MPKPTEHIIEIDGKEITVTVEELKLRPFTPEEIAAEQAADEAKRRKRMFRAMKRIGQTADSVEDQYRAEFLAA